MTLKNIVHTGLCGLLLMSAASCRKSSALDVDMSKYVVDNPAPSDLDNWIMTNLTNPYNIQLQYRFDRNLQGDVAKDVSPVSLDKVQPTAQAIINIFLKTYEKVAGAPFIKTYTPKQFVLFGSPAYNPDGSLTLGSADGGRRVILYDLNSLDFTNPAQVSAKMLTIHHEFTHILNQTVAMQPEFQLITASDYMLDWTNATNSNAVAQSLGFVSRYARQDYNEDFAEMVASLLIKGQLWFDTYAKAAGADGQSKLKQKEAMVVDYFRQYLNVNFRDLQYEVGKVLRDTYNDKTRGFLYAWQNNLLANPLVVDFNQPYYAQFGQSTKFATIWSQVKAGLATVGYTPVSFNVVFVSPTVIQMQHTLSNAAGAVVAWYDYNIAVNANGEITFTKFDNGSTAPQYVNGRTALPAFVPLNNYLATKLFKADWMPATATNGGSNYLKYAGFYVSTEPDNYFYGKF